MQSGRTVRFSMAGQGIAFETRRFRVRTLKQADASDAYLSWIADPAVMGPLNMPARTLSPDDLKQHIARFNGHSRHLLGMFDKKTGDHFGVFLIEVMAQHRVAKLSYLIGDSSYRGIGALRESAEGLIAHLFSVRGIEKLTAQVTVGNDASIAALEALGFEREGLMRGEILSFQPAKGRLDQYFFGLLRSDWKARAAEA